MTLFFFKLKQLDTGAYPGGMHRMHVHPPYPPVHSPPSLAWKTGYEGGGGLVSQKCASPRQNPRYARPWLDMLKKLAEVPLLIMFSSSIPPVAHIKLSKQSLWNKFTFRIFLFFYLFICYLCQHVNISILYIVRQIYYVDAHSSRHVNRRLFIWS